MFSRYKEYFGLSKRKEWNDFILYLKKNPQALTNVNPNWGLSDIKVSQINSDEIQLELTSVDYVYEDLLKIERNDDSYQRFV